MGVDKIGFLYYCLDMTLETNNDKRFDLDLERGKVGEDTHNAFLVGKHEVKTDSMTVKTGNFYIETKQYNENFEALSGINTTEAEWWVQASPKGIGGIYISTEELKELMREVNPPETRQPIHNSQTNASTGRLLKLDDVLRHLGFK
jgi:hypothetical protein